MSKWYNDVVSDMGKIPDMITYFENELEVAKTELNVVGTLEKHARELPGITEHRFSQLQEVEAILEFLNVTMKKTRSQKFKTYLYNFEKALTSRDAEKFVDGDDEVIAMAYLINEVSLLRNKYLSYHKGLEAKHWQLSNIVKLRCAGLEDINL